MNKQTLRNVIGEYLKFFPLSLEYSLSASGNIPNVGEIILNIHLIVSNYLYISVRRVMRFLQLLAHISR